MPVDLPFLVKRIVVAKTYPLWAIDTLQNSVRSAGVSIEVEPSDLLKEPEPIEAQSATVGV